MTLRIAVRPFLTTFRCMSGAEYGSGSGKGNGSGGSIRDGGGVFGKMEATREVEYFHKLKKAQFSELRAEYAREIEYHENLQNNHADAIARNKKRIEEIANEEENLKQQIVDNKVGIYDFIVRKNVVLAVGFFGIIMFACFCLKHVWKSL